MSKNGLHRHYDKLSPEERFRMDVLAMARGDEQESERLVSSCPRFSYTMTDRAFSSRWLGALDVTMRAYHEVSERLERLTMIEVVRVALPYHEGFARDRMLDAFVEGHKAGARQGWREAGGKGPAPEWPLDGVDEAKVDELADEGASVLPEILEKFERLQAAEALTLWLAFGAFSADTLGLDATKLLGIVYPSGLSRIEKLEETAERLGLEPDTETLEAERRCLVDAWGMVEGRAA